tara:strand:- start:846 stop:1358 length:513 start_codon:yes stop_codon:yes gene_type:complete
MNKFFKLFLFLVFTSCSSSPSDNISDYQSNDVSDGDGPGLFSKDSSKGINISKLLNRDENSGGSFYVNSYLWRASLEIASIAPLTSTDAFGGTILTGWYEDPKIKNKRIKLAVFVKSRELRSDGVKVKVYIQNINNNKWSKITHDKKLATKIEEVILSKARELRLKNKQK